MLTVETLTDKIREQAGEIEILKLKVIGLEDDLALANAPIPTAPAEPIAAKHVAHKRE